MSTAPPATGYQTVLYDGRTSVFEHAHIRDGDLWLAADDLAAATRWEVKPEGICRDEMCVVVPTGKNFVWESEGQEWFNLTEFARHLHQPVAHDEAHDIWSFGPAQFEWQNRLALQMAPDFTLPDFEGKPHSLSDYRGKKVFLVTWASW